MSRLIVLALVVVALAVGAFWLAGRDGTQPQVRVEKIVPDNAIAR